MPACARTELSLLLTILSAAVMELASASPSLAQNGDTATAPSGFDHAALTVEGGGTLGAYEGGLTWTLVEIFRQRRVMGLPDSVKRRAAKPIHSSTIDTAMLLKLPRFELHASAGASAGSINAFIAANRWCATDPAQREDDSSFWRVWVLTGLSEVLPRRRDADWHSEKAVFTRSRFSPIFAKLDSTWDDSSYDPNCKVLFGAAITRLASDSVEITERIHPRNQRYAAAFAVAAPQSGTKGLRYQPPLADSDSRLRLGALVQLPSGRRGGTIRHAYAHALLNASSGYPLAFQPQLVHYCGAMSPATPGTSVACTESVADSAYFLDGGVFDNGPLTLGYGMALTADPNVNLDNLNMLFVSPSQRRFTGNRHDVYSGDKGVATARRDSTSVSPSRDPEVAREGLDALAELLKAFIPSARQYELQIAGRLLPVVQKADRQRGNSQTNLALAEARATHERKRAEYEYQSRRRELNEAARATDSVRFERDSLRYMLATCRLSPTPCLAAPEDSVAQAPQRREVPEVKVPTLESDLTLTRAATDEIRFQDLLFTSTRWHPLAGDWLFGFGGFIGRALREYDFYVGAYDGLALVAQQIMCRDSRDDPSCFQDSLSALINRPIVSMSTKGTTALKALYDEEFRPIGRDKLLSTADSSANPVTVNIIKAMGSRMSTGWLAANACESGGRLERMSCADGIETVFDILRRTPDFAARGMVQECVADSTTGKMKCTDDPTFTAFVNNPSVAMNKLTGQVLERLLDATPDSSGLETPLKFATATFFATNERTRRGLDAGSVSLPSLPMKKLFLFYALPSSVGGFGGVPGWYLEWAARKHLNSNATLGVAGRFVWASGFKDSTTTHQGRIVIPALRGEVKPWGRLSPLISTAGIDLAYWSDERPYVFWRNWSNRGLTVAGTAALFAQRLRVSVYRRPERYWIRSGDKPSAAVSIGVGDTNGLLYWLTH